MNPQITQYHNQNALPIDQDEVKRFTTEILNFFKIATDEIIIHFVSEEKIKVLHGLFFENTDTTDCISFPIDGLEVKQEGVHHTLGECFINPEEALNYSPENPYLELSRYIVHCILHFRGHTDETPKEKQAIHALEDLALDHAALKKVLLSNPHPLYR